MASECLYCLAPTPKPTDDDMPAVCAACRREADEGDKYRKWKADFDKRNAGKVLGVSCSACWDYIPRSTWGGDGAPTLCYICESGRKHKEFVAEMKRWREEDEAAAPYIIEAMRAVLLGKK